MSTSEVKAWKVDWFFHVKVLEAKLITLHDKLIEMGQQEHLDLAGAFALVNIGEALQAYRGE